MIRSYGLGSEHPLKTRRCGCQVFQVDTLEGLVVSVNSETGIKQISAKLASTSQRVARYLA